MAYGPGKYDDLATYVREKAEAKGMLILVLDGNRGSGFSAQGVGHDPARYVARILRDLADQLDRGQA